MTLVYSANTNLKSARVVMAVTSAHKLIINNHRSHERGGGVIGQSLTCSGDSEWSAHIPDSLDIHICSTHLHRY